MLSFKKLSIHQSSNISEKCTKSPISVGKDSRFLTHIYTTSILTRNCYASPPAIGKCVFKIKDTFSFTL